MDDKIRVRAEDSEVFSQEINSAQKRISPKINVDAEKVENGLARLVLTLIELIRQLLEQQALRRMEHGSLTDEEIERMGNTFAQLAAKMEELKHIFGLDNEDLNLNLGPLGKLF